MTINEFNTYNNNGNMPCEWIGQGYGYKDMETDWEDMNEEDIIYIPEYGYEEFLGVNYVERSSAYSKGDFIQLVVDYCKGNDISTADQKMIDDIARDVFNWVDWQFPTTVIDEGYLDDCFGEEE